MGIEVVVESVQIVWITEYLAKCQFDPARRRGQRIARSVRHRQVRLPQSPHRTATAGAWIDLDRRNRHHDLHPKSSTRSARCSGCCSKDGALFGSMDLYDNVAFPLREHTKKSEAEIRRIVMEKLELVGLQGADGKLPGEISGGMRKRAGLARALVLDPQDHPGRRARLPAWTRSAPPTSVNSFSTSTRRSMPPS